jgi:uncharacterized protein YjbI with pentapeptide repeats
MTKFAPHTAEYQKIKTADVKKLRGEILKDQAAWNQRRAGKEDRYQLASADFSGQELIGIDLRFADLRCAKFQGANLSKANLYAADLSGADLRDSYGHSAEFSEANLLECRFDNSGYDSAKFDETHLGDANFYRASLRQADFANAFLHNAKFEAANLHGTTGFVPSSTLIRDARFAITSTDLWSQLRRAYTGPKFIVNLLFLVVFLIPYLAKAIYWRGINQSQLLLESAAGSLASVEMQSFYLCLANECTQTSIWYLVLGLDRPISYWLLGTILIAYNVLRGILTFLVAPLRDEEERTGYSPRHDLYYRKPFDKFDATNPVGTVAVISDFLTRLRESYGWMNIPHKSVVALFYFAFISFVWHMYGWLTLTVYIPTP